MNFKEQISQSGLSIYDPLTGPYGHLFIPTKELESLLQNGLAGKNYGDLPLRTRSKTVNMDICSALGYPVPSSFKKTKPRFPGQDFDKYVQKALNLQVWNEEISPERRYVVIQQRNNGDIGRVRVISGDELARYDKTGTLTQKYQAKLKPSLDAEALNMAISDTDNIQSILGRVVNDTAHKSLPSDNPLLSDLKPIEWLYSKLSQLIGSSITDAGLDQERNRGAELHRAACELLGYRSYSDNGQFPDIRNQLLEVKLQTSPTIDLGLVLPTSEQHLEGLSLDGRKVRHCDVRYAVFYGETDGSRVIINSVYMASGENFFSIFQQFGGMTVNKKLQIPLPSDFFSA